MSKLGSSGVHAGESVKHDGAEIAPIEDDVELAELEKWLAGGSIPTATYYRFAHVQYV
jgi:hypothetical protein